MSPLVTLTEPATSSLPADSGSETGAGLSGSEPLAISEIAEAQLVPQPPTSWPFRLLRFFNAVGQYLFGLVSLIIGLAVLATIPILQFISLGYLLELSGRIARQGKLREALTGLPVAARIGSIVLGTWLMLVPVRYLADVAYSVELLAPGSSEAGAWRIGVFIFTTLMVGHILLAWYSGGKLRHFLWPLLAIPFLVWWLGQRLLAAWISRPLMRRWLDRIAPRVRHDLSQVEPLNSWFPPAVFLAGLRRGRMYSEARDAVWNVFQQFRTSYYLWLGVRGFCGATMWLVVPLLLLIGSTRLPNGLNVLSGIAGSLTFALVWLHLPFMQTRFAAEGRFKVFFELREIRQMFRRAPLSFLLALVVTLVLALPLYLLKIEATPREVTWLPSLVFVIFILPTRIFLGWAVARANRRTTPTWRILSWPSRLISLPVVAAYTFLVFFTQYTSWYGAWSLFEQHALLVPVPFLGG